MADKIELKVDQRKTTGKKVRFLRREGIVPLHLFGHNLESQALQGDAATLGKVLAQAGGTRLVTLKIGDSPKSHNVMVREVQRDPIRGNLIHVDLYEVNMTEEVRVEVPVTITGESPALKVRENMLYQTMDSLLIECLPDSIPDKIEVDISSIQEVDQAIHVKDISIPGVTILNDPDLQIVKVSLRPVETVEGARPGVTAAEGTPAAGTAEGAAGGKA
jgi:large subunit ribosomal protein L25